MSNIKLIIQRTLNGLEVDYTSGSINERELESDGILYDERNQINQLDCSVVLSVTNTMESKVYSYINNRVLDVSKRKGFYAIRLIVPRSKRLPHVYQILQKVAERYDQYRVSNTVNTLSYDDILQDIKLAIQSDKMVLSNAINKSTYYSFIDFATQGDNALNNQKLELFHKTYLLNVVDKESEPLLKEVGIMDLNVMVGQIKIFKIDDPDNLLTGIWINDINADNGTIKNNYIEIACFHTDVIHYTSVLNNGRKTPLSSDHLVLKRPAPVYKPGRSHSSSRGSSSSAPYWFALLALVIGLAGGYFGEPYLDFSYLSNMTPVSSEENVYEPLNPIHLSINNAGSSAFLLETDSTTKDTLSGYLFKYDPKGTPTWRFRKKTSAHTEKELTKADLHSILNKDTIKANQLMERLKQYADIPIKDSVLTIPSKLNERTKRDGGTIPNVTSGE